MAIRFNANEVLTMAEEIEENGAKFYRRAAELHPEKHNSDFLSKLADMEVIHKGIFATMRSRLPAALKEDTAFDPFLEAELYLNAMADAHGGEGTPSVADKLTGKESMADILRTAIGLEEKSIVFYLGLRDMVPEKLGKDKIDAIIAEEKSHMVTLAAELRKT